MSRVLLSAILVFAALGSIYLILVIAQMTKRAQWPGDSPQYRNHLNMARWIERQLRDDMVQVTIAPTEKDDARRLLEQFYGERQVGEGE